MFSILIPISLLISKVQIDKTSAMAQVIVWYWSDSKQLPEPILTKDNDTIMHHQGPVT